MVKENYNLFTLNDIQGQNAVRKPAAKMVAPPPAKVAAKTPANPRVEPLDEPIKLLRMDTKGNIDLYQPEEVEIPPRNIIPDDRPPIISDNSEPKDEPLKFEDVAENEHEIQQYSVNKEAENKLRQYRDKNGERIGIDDEIIDDIIAGMEGRGEELTAEKIYEKYLKLKPEYE